MPYIYRPLNGDIGEIRLLTIQVAFEGESTDGPLRCTLEHVPSNPQVLDRGDETTDENFHTSWGHFAALSYEWGSREPRRHILLHGEPFDITPNLANALRQVRRAAAAEDLQWLTLWVDAVCIDQSNIYERNAQVSRMRQIFGSAAHTYCYLTPLLPPAARIAIHDGVPEEYKYEMQVAADLIAQINKVPEFPEEDFFDRLERTCGVFTTFRWRAITRFFNSSYWQRLWIIQEICVSSRITILFDDGQIRFEDAYNAGDRLSKHSDITSSRIESVACATDFPEELAHLSTTGCVGDIGRLRYKICQARDFQSDLETLQLSRYASSTDPRDKVYGILGVISTSLAITVDVDYRKSTEASYTDFAASFIRTTTSLNILSECTMVLPESIDVLPSWVPDLRTLATPVALHGFRMSSGLAHLAEPSIVSQSRLSTPGIYLDRIDGLAAVRPQDKRRALHCQTPDGVVHCDNPNRSDHQYGDFSGLANAFWCTLFCYPDQHPTLPGFCLTKDKFATLLDLLWARHLLEFLVNNKSFLIAGHEMHSFFADPADPDVIETASSFEEYDWSNVLDHIRRHSACRRLAFTIGGRLAHVPADSRKGDVIYALSGYDVLAVLRKHGDEWKFVGECYVCGLMDPSHPAFVQGKAEHLQIT